MNWNHPYILSKQAYPQLMNKEALGFDDAATLFKGYGHDISSGMSKGYGKWKNNFYESRKRNAEQSAFGTLGADFPLILGGLGIAALGGGAALGAVKGVGGALKRRFFPGAGAAAAKPATVLPPSGSGGGIHIQ
jgi:hypothetical protein